MSTRIYQAYYQDSQKIHLDPNFTPFDNRVNPISNLYERYIYQQTAEISRRDGIDLWGTFSWQWRKKLIGPNSEDILNFINNNPGNDVYIFNPYPQLESISYNVWEQGEWCHPNMIQLSYAILKLMGEDPELIKQPMTRETYLTANYFVATNNVWTGLLEFLDRYVLAIENLDEDNTKLLLRSAGYSPNMSLNYTGFICERLISTYFIKHPEFKIMPWAGPENLSDLKMLAVKTKNKDSILEWNKLRSGQKIATSWIEKQF